MLEPHGDSLKRAWTKPTIMAAELHPTVLALDAAGGACSAALWRDGVAVARRWEAMERGHAEVLMPMVEAVVADQGYEAIDLLCVGTGPGGYTGLRIALAAARGLALATKLPILGIPNFDVHHQRARQTSPDGPLAVILETRRADFYVQVYDADGAPSGEPEVFPLPALEARLGALRSSVVLAGDAVDRFRNASTSADESWEWLEPQHADAAVLAELGAARMSLASHVPPNPLYLRPPDVSSPAADRQRLRG